MDENLRFTYQRNLKHRVLRVLKTFLFLDYVLKSQFANWWPIVIF